VPLGIASARTQAAAHLLGHAGRRRLRAEAGQGQERHGAACCCETWGFAPSGRPKSSDCQIKHPTNAASRQESLARAPSTRAGSCISRRHIIFAQGSCRKWRSIGFVWTLLRGGFLRIDWRSFSGYAGSCSPMSYEISSAIIPRIHHASCDVTFRKPKGLPMRTLLGSGPINFLAGWVIG